MGLSIYIIKGEVCLGRVVSQTYPFSDTGVEIGHGFFKRVWLYPELFGQLSNSRCFYQSPFWSKVIGIDNIPILGVKNSVGTVTLALATIVPNFA